MFVGLFSVDIVRKSGKSGCHWIRASALYHTCNVVLLFTVVQRDEKLPLLVGDCARESPFTIPDRFEFGYR